MADGCRFRFPRLIVTSKMQAEAAAESRDSFQVQKYAFAVSHNPVATTELPCNQCLEVCPNTKGSIIYTVSYVSKVDGARDTDPQAAELLALEALSRYIEAGRQVEPERLTEKMTLSCVNKINSMAHLSMPMIMTYLMGYPDFYSSHTHRFVSLDLFHRRMRKPEVVMVKGSYQHQRIRASLSTRRTTTSITFAARRRIEAWPWSSGPRRVRNGRGDRIRRESARARPRQPRGGATKRPASQMVVKPRTLISGPY